MPEDNQSVWCNFQNTVKLMIINEVLHSKWEDYSLTLNSDPKTAALVIY